MESTSDTLEEVKALLEAGWTVDWGGRTGAEYPPNQRLVEFEKSLDDEPYTRVRKLHLLEKDYEEVEKLREEGDGDDGDDGDDEQQDQQNQED
ncbi:hypothetical protein [Halalkalicoccus salilacus]|uniref:hypothetical protein n=1 Tax=Halalkalicoccus TaxID=332246 RepID=UPI002F967972